MLPKTFHFKSYEPAIRYHLSSQLRQRGWVPVAEPGLATFNDNHLCLNDNVSIVLEYKHLLAWMARQFFPELMPETFVLNDVNFPDVLNSLKQHPQAQKPWILKPSLLNNGDDIKVFDSIDGVVQHYSTPRRLGGYHVVQRYIEPPKLWHGRKFSLRIPAVLTNDAGVYVYSEGYLNISHQPYESSLQAARSVHITNYILDGQLAGIEQQLLSALPDFTKVYSGIVKAIKKVVQAVSAIFPDYLKSSTTSSFEIFGFDFMLDAQGKLWLLEVNQGPDFPMNSDHALYQSLWMPFWSDMVETFVEPRLHKSSISTLNSQFKQILTYQQAQKPKFWQRYKGKQFYREYSSHIVVQG